jgi:hypothetical protein
MPNYLNTDHVAPHGISQAERFSVDHHFEPPAHLHGLGYHSHRRYRKHKVVAQPMGGLGQITSVPAGSAPPGFLANVWATLVGQPQSYYDEISDDQKQLNLVMAGVTAVGQPIWDEVALNTAQGPVDTGDGSAPNDSGTTSSNLSGIDSYATAIANLTAALQSIIITTNNAPTMAVIQAAEAVINNYQNQLAYVQAAVPETASQVQTDQAQVDALISNTPMQSPAAAGAQGFIDALPGQPGWNPLSLIPTWVWWTAGGLGALWVWWKFGGRS